VAFPTSVGEQSGLWGNFPDNYRTVLKVLPYLGLELVTRCTDSPQETLSHPPGGRLPLLSARPAVTCVAFTRWRQPYTVAHVRFWLTTHLSTPKGLRVTEVPYGWEGNRRSSVGLAKWVHPPTAPQRLRKGDDHSACTPCKHKEYMTLYWVRHRVYGCVSVCQYVCVYGWRAPA